MQFSGTILALAAAVVSAQDVIKVAVGQYGLTYTPNDITAAVGQKVEFSFFASNHTVTQSSFDFPCHPLASGGIFSGFIATKAPGPNAQTFTITVENKKPIWLYCSQNNGRHCQSGMVMAINAPKTGNTLAAYTALAENTTTSTAPENSVQGGILSGGENGGNKNGGNTGNNTSSATTYTSTVATSATSVLTSVYTGTGTTYITEIPTLYPTTYATTVVAGTGAAAAPSASPPVELSNNAVGSGPSGVLGVAALVAGWALL